MVKIKIMFTFSGIKQNMSFAQVMLYSHHLHFIRIYVFFFFFFPKEIRPNHNKNLIDPFFGDIHNQIFDEMPHNGSKWGVLNCFVNSL